MQQAKIFFFFVRPCLAKTFFFFKIKTVKIGLGGVCQTHLKTKKAFNKNIFSQKKS